MLLILLIFLAFFPVKILLAAPEIVLKDLPENISSNTSFPVIIEFSGLKNETQYYYKFFGGINDDTSVFKTTPSLSYTSSWKNFPFVTSDASGSGQLQSTVYAIPDLSTGNYNLKCRFAQASNTSTTITSQSYPLNLISVPTAIPTLLPTSTPTPLVTPEPTVEADVIITEIMANPPDSVEWVEFYNFGNQELSLKNLCLSDLSLHKKCVSEDIILVPGKYYQYKFSGSFLNNSGDTIYFLNQSITFPKSPQNYTYSIQSDGSWCFSNPSPATSNYNCYQPEETVEITPLPPQLNLTFLPQSVEAGSSLNITFNLKSDDLYSIRLDHPFDSPYFAFNSFDGTYSWVNLLVSIPKKTQPGDYDLLFRLKKATESKTHEFRLGKINITSAKVISKKNSSKLPVPQIICPPITPSVLGTSSAQKNTSLHRSPPDSTFFSWPFLFAGSILLLSPIIFPKLYSD